MSVFPPGAVFSIIHAGITSRGFFYKYIFNIYSLSTYYVSPFALTDETQGSGEKISPILVPSSSSLHPQAKSLVPLFSWAIFLDTPMNSFNI